MAKRRNRAHYVLVAIPADCTITGLRVAVSVERGDIKVVLYDREKRVAASPSGTSPR